MKLLQARGLKGTIIGHTPMSPQARGHEIRTYLERFKRGEEGAGILDTFVILDDDEAGMRGYSGGMDLRTNHVVTTWYGQEVGAGAGLTTTSRITDSSKEACKTSTSSWRSPS